MREKALEEAVKWHARHPKTETAKEVVDTASEFLVFLEGETKVSQPIKNPAAKGQPR